METVAPQTTPTILPSVVVTVFVRHSSTCKSHDEGEFFKRCRCRKHLRRSMNGTQHRKTAGTRSWEEAEQVKRSLQDQLSGRPLAKQTAAAVTIRQAYEHFLREHRIQKVGYGYCKSIEVELLRFVEFCEMNSVFTFDSLLTDVTKLTEYKQTWSTYYPSSGTQEGVQKRLRKFLRFAHNAGWLARVPAMRAVSVNEPPTMPLTDEEYDNLLTAIPKAVKNGSGQRLRGIILLMRWSGLAVRDASTLPRAHFFLHKSGKFYCVQTERQKTKKEAASRGEKVIVHVPVPLEIGREIMDIAQDYGDEEHLWWKAADLLAVSFANIIGKQISDSFDEAKIVADCFMVSHRLRDTFAVHYLMKGVALEDVSKMLGHKSIAVTEKHYAPWVKGRQDRLNAVVAATWLS